MSPSDRPVFRERVLRAVRRISWGEVRSYRQVAVAAGSPRSARAVGRILNGNRDPAVPCHRVIGSDGRLVGYNRGLRAKSRLLAAEGVEIRGGRVVIAPVCAKGWK